MSEDLATSSKWYGTYLLESGSHLRCHEFYQFDKADWGDEDIIGAVYYELDDKDGPENIDGGVMGYHAGCTFDQFVQYIEREHGERIIDKLPENHGRYE